MDNFRQKSVLLIVGIVFFLGTGVAFGQTNETIIIDNLGAGVPEWDDNETEPTMADLITPSGDNGYITWTANWRLDEQGNPYQTTWYEAGGNGCYGPNYLYSDHLYKDIARYRFIPRIPAGGGTYEVWIHYTFGEYRSPKVPVVIRHADSGEFGNDVYYINMQEDDDHWVYVASVRFNEFEHDPDPENPTDDYGFVQLSGCNLRVCVDAVKLVPTNMVSPKARDDSAELDFSPFLPVLPRVEIPILVNDSAIPHGPSIGRFPVKIVRQPAYGKVRLARCSCTTSDRPSNRPSICAVYTLHMNWITDKVFGDTFEYSVNNGKYSDTALVTVNFHERRTHYSEVRAVWLNRHAFDNDYKRDKLIALLNMGNINTIYVTSPQFTRSSVEYFGQSFKVSFDPLYERICENNEADVSFHIWILNERRGSHLNDDGSIDWNHVDWEDDNESAAQVEWAEALINEYPEADGIHFDYIRQEDTSSPLNDVAMAHITETVVDTKAMIDKFNSDHPEYPHKHLTAATKSNWRECRWGSSQVPDWYKKWFNRNDGQAPGGWNYVKNGVNYIPKFLNYAQDCSGWIIRDEIDSITDMSYSEGIFYWQKRMLTHKSFANDWCEGCDEKFSRVCMGLQDNYEFHEPEMILQKINEGRLHGCKGFSIFQLTTKDDDCIDKSQLLMKLLTGPTGPYHKRADSWLQD